MAYLFFGTVGLEHFRVFGIVGGAGVGSLHRRKELIGLGDTASFGWVLKSVFSNYTLGYSFSAKVEFSYIDRIPG